MTIFMTFRASYTLAPSLAAGRSYERITWRALALWEKLEKACSSPLFPLASRCGRSLTTSSMARRAPSSVLWPFLAATSHAKRASNQAHFGAPRPHKKLSEGEKYACAELMVDEIKSAGGIMPKVSQTLAMKPDVVKARLRGLRRYSRSTRYHELYIEYIVRHNLN